jgi:hypothetical protein
MTKLDSDEQFEVLVSDGDSLIVRCDVIGSKECGWLCEEVSGNYYTEPEELANYIFECYNMGWKLGLEKIE